MFFLVEYNLLGQIFLTGLGKFVHYPLKTGDEHTMLES